METVKLRFVTWIMPFLMGLLLAPLSLWGQVGKEYIGTNSVTEKSYEVRQRFGVNIKKLASISHGEYDASGIIVNKTEQAANRTFMGHTVCLRSTDPFSLQTLKYNNMGQLTSRNVDIYGEKQEEITSIEYDTKGKIMHKSTTRYAEDSSDLITVEYNAVGNVYRYYRVVHDDKNRIGHKFVYNYAGDYLEEHIYTYNELDKLVKIVANSKSNAGNKQIGDNPAKPDSVIYSLAYKYDERGNTIETSRYDDKGYITESESCVYDDKNRLIQKSKYLWSQRFGGTPNLRKQTNYEYD